MTDYVNSLNDFQTALSQKLDGTIQGASQEPNQPFRAGTYTSRLRGILIEEEAREVCQALKSGNADDVLKELADLIVVTVGTAVVYGMDIDTAFERVHENNMAKIKNGTVRDDGKLVKPRDHPKVDLKDLV